MKERFIPALFGAVMGIFILAWGTGNMTTQQLAKEAADSDKSRFAAIARNIMPSVVQVISLASVPREKKSDSDPSFIEDLQRKLNGIWSPEYEVTSIGSGIVIGKRGHIVTSYHLIADAQRIVVQLSSPQVEVNAALIGVDRMTDLALLKISSNLDLAPVTFADSKKLSRGEWVMAVGSPFNLGKSVTAGVISALGRSNLGMIDIEDYIQTDAKIFPGNSGGPLVDIHGEVVGINTAVYAMGSGIGFAIPSSEVIYVINSLIRSGTVDRGKIGVTTQAMTPALASSLGAPGIDGALVVSVEPGSPSELAGILRGDIIISFGRLDVASPMELRRFALKKKPGDQVIIELFRSGEMVALDVTIGALYK